ncbi:Arm DNA-binding domain-containing protein [Pseudomonas nitroreducens]|uniref:Arm DNA-binding domain-containing protein n=1 Tax=Pseudomonas nitroreducens TaxID=46680 RepID=UPI0037FADECE
MADGVEVRGNRIRVYFRYQGELCREAVAGDATPENVANAERLAGIINYEIKHGTFSYSRHFPDSSRVQTNTLGHYLDLWLEIKRTELAPSGFRTYKSKVETHIRPRWGSHQADQIDHLDMQTWVKADLMTKLHNKTVREIVSIVGQVYTIYRTRNRSSHDPTEGITIRLPDPDEADPFDREEIAAILGVATERYQELALAQFMIWAGPRVSEAIALSWEDVDLDAGTVRFRRSQVRGHYKVTKTRRSTREIRLLKPALQALMAQKAVTSRLPPVEIEVTDRDNKTKKRQKVRFVFHNSSTGAAHTSSDVLLQRWWQPHLKMAGVRYRGPNNCRHTFASQLLTSGVVPLDWIADQMGHTSTAMIWRHYGKWINQDGPDMIGLLEHALKL